MDMKSDIRRLNNTVANNEFQEPASLALQERQIVSRNEFQGLNLLILQRQLESSKFFFVFLRHSSSLLLPLPQSFSFWGSHLLPGQDLDVISIPFQIYFIQATTTRLIEPMKLQQSSFWCVSLGEYNRITGFFKTKAIGSQGGCLLYTQVDPPQDFLIH